MDIGTDLKQGAYSQPQIGMSPGTHAMAVERTKVGSACNIDKIE